ncbi:MAG: hypothetical protein CL878_01855 [Dehalococcoidia bacterium]|nr:hypothetical protein [Dehalococcoidia bacterium]
MQLPLFDPPDTSSATPAPSFASLSEARTAALACTRCGLSRIRRQVVFGAGAAPARLFVLGEGPSESDDTSGEPFSGPSGHVLNSWLSTMATSRAEVWISNVLRCRAPEPGGQRAQNRPPRPSEVKSCRYWLDIELAFVSPEVVLCLGATPGRVLLGRGFKLRQDRGKWATGPGCVPVLPTYNPAYLLRLRSSQRAEAEAAVSADLRLVRARLGVADSPPP